MTNSQKSPPSIQEQLSRVFAYRAEWLRDLFFDLFTEPSYLPQLTTERPCVLIGGRGTGKTTVLRGLSYDVRYKLFGAAHSDVKDWPYYGIYHRVNTNRVSAFRGPELDEDQWVKVFAHYVNLVLCDSVLSFIEWYQLRTSHVIVLPEEVCARIGASLHLESVTTVTQLARALSSAKVLFEASINNISDEVPPNLSLQGHPLDELMAALLKLPEFQGRLFFFLLDEFENLSDYQQRVLNTLIKHAGDFYTFKLGVKELGWRMRTTLNLHEQLTHPADYARISIPEKLEGEQFRRFAAAICNKRLAVLLQENSSVIRDIELALPGLDIDTEADLLGVGEVAATIRKSLESDLTSDEIIQLSELKPLELYFLKYWSEGHDTTLVTEMRDLMRDRAHWLQRYDNHKYASLFTIRQGLRGIRKYYCGWETFTQIAATNIRYLIELVDQSFLAHVAEGKSLSEPIGFDTQTIAAQAAGRKKLLELEGLSLHGARLTKLLLGLGRVFNVLASQPSGHTPEVNQFHITDSDVPQDVEELVKAAVMHLALVRETGNKLAGETDTKEFDYMVHPLFSPFFVFSHRKKRKMNLTAKDLRGLVEKPRSAIREVLLRQKRDTVIEGLPQQLTLFERFYNGDE